MTEEEARAQAADRWLVGDCHVLSLVLHRMTGWPLMSLHDARICGGSHIHMDDCGMLVHSGVRRPDGRFLDAGGIRSPNRTEIEDAYLDFPDRARWMVGDEEFDADDLRAVVPMSVDDFDAAAVDAAAFVQEHLSEHLTGFPMSPQPEAGQPYAKCAVDYVDIAPEVSSGPNIPF